MCPDISLGFQDSFYIIGRLLEVGLFFGFAALAFGFAAISRNLLVFFFFLCHKNLLSINNEAEEGAKAPSIRLRGNSVFVAVHEVLIQAIRNKGGFPACGLTLIQWISRTGRAERLE